MIVASSNPVLKWAALLASAASLVLAAVFAGMLAEGGAVPVLLALIAVCLLNAAGLLRLTAWARRTSTVMLWLLILYAVGRFNPKYVDQFAARGQVPPDVSYLILTTLAIAVPCLAVLYVFRKYKQDFRRQWF